MIDLQKILSTKAQAVEAWLRRWFEQYDGLEIYPRRLLEASHWSLFSGGKRFRPALCLLVNQACGSEDELALPLAAALELIHTYSLIHDDLPAMDDDDFRRGVATSHKKFDEATAILAGDALLTEAFNCLTEISARDLIPWLVRGLSRAAGYHGMVAGQMMDIEAEQGRAEKDQATLSYIHSHKTGALIEASLVLPGILNRLDEKKLSELKAFGASLGLVFQIADDILDETADETKLGKPLRSDSESDKLTWTRVYGLEKSREMARLELEKAYQALAEWGSAAEPLRDLARFAVERDY